MEKKRKLYLFFVLSLYFNLINAQIGSSEVFTNIGLSNDVRAFSSNDEMFYVQRNETGGCYLAKIENLNSASLPINEEVFVVDLPGFQEDYVDLKYLQNNLYLLIEPVSTCNLRCPFCFQTDKTFTKKPASVGSCRDASD